MSGNERAGGRILGSLGSADGKGVVRMEDRFDTDIDDVWSALTDPSRLARWYGEVEGDLRLGEDPGARRRHAGQLQLLRPGAAAVRGRARGGAQPAARGGRRRALVPALPVRSALLARGLSEALQKASVSSEAPRLRPRLL